MKDWSQTKHYPKGHKVLRWVAAIILHKTSKRNKLLIINFQKKSYMSSSEGA